MKRCFQRSPTIKDDGNELGTDTKIESLLKKSAGILEEVDNSPIFQNKPTRSFPSFQLHEIQLGEVLGIGAFGVVREVSKILCRKSDHEEEQYWIQSSLNNDTGEDPTGYTDGSTDQSTNDEEGKLYGGESSSDDGEEQLARENMSQRYLRAGSARYAVKSISNSLSDMEWARGRIDLAIEIKYLRVLDHPNIIRMRGVFETDNLIHPCNFFVMDRLYGTIVDRVREWKCDMNDSKLGFFRKIEDSVLHALMTERLTVAFDIASAFNYMHDHQIIHRDIKPQNIGFDVRGDVKVFDFGLAKSIKLSSKAQPNAVFNLTGKTGSYPYMAPEVAKKLPYNEKCDVFSFSLVLYEIITLKAPYNLKNQNHKKIYKKVVVNGSRPSIPRRCCSEGIKNLIKQSWMVLPEDRPTMKEISRELGEEIDGIEHDADARAKLLIDRSARSLNGTKNDQGVFRDVNRQMSDSSFHSF